MESTALVIMAKHPTPGRVKTRLQPTYSPEQSAAVQRIFLEHLVKRFTTLRLGQIVVCYDPPETRDSFAGLLPATATHVLFLPQSAGDLGARLALASRKLADDFARIFFFGVDSPDVPDTHLHAIITHLDSHPVVIAPTDDGGFWSIGHRREIDLANVLTGIEWSSGREMAQVVEHLNRDAVPVAMAEAWTDVDRPDDLSALLTRLNSSPAAHDGELLAKLLPVINGNGVLQ